MFTFLDNDGVPWNNNNAEHAIKRFAKYRRNTDGYFTERSLQEYLVLATVFETCEFNRECILSCLKSSPRKSTSTSSAFSVQVGASARAFGMGRFMLKNVSRARVFSFPPRA